MTTIILATIAVAKAATINCFATVFPIPAKYRAARPLWHAIDNTASNKR